MSQKIYCSFSIFEDIFNKEDVEYSILLKILIEYSNIYLDISNDKIEEIMRNLPYQNLIRRANLTLSSDEDLLNNIKDADFSKYTTDMFLLDNVDSRFTKQIRNEYGVFVLSYDEIKHIHEYNTSFRFWFLKNNKGTNNWSDALSKKTITPCSAAIISDNYLFKRKKYYKENLYTIISKLVCKKLKTDFHLTLISKINHSFKKGVAESLIIEIEKKFKNVKVGIITHTNPKIHERVILTNHHYLYSDKGFNIILDNNIKEQTKGSINWVYSNIKNELGVIYKEEHSEYLDIFKKNSKN